VPPTQSDVKETILSSSPDNWEFIDAPQTWVLWSEQITIETLGLSHTDSQQDISQPDFASLPDPDHDQEASIRISYKGTPFHQIPVLILDGGGIRMIKPNRDHSDGTRHITEFEAHLSQIMSMDDFRMKQGRTIDVEIRGRGI